MVAEIYWGSGSPNSWRVLLAAELLGVPHESRLLEFSRGQHKDSGASRARSAQEGAGTPRRRRRARRVARDRRVLDAIKGGSLYGKTRREAAVIRRLIFEFECCLREPLSKVASHLFVVGVGGGARRPPSWSKRWRRRPRGSRRSQGATALRTRAGRRSARLRTSHLDRKPFVLSRGPRSRQRCCGTALAVDVARFRSDGY